MLLAYLHQRKGQERQGGHRSDLHEGQRKRVRLALQEDLQHVDVDRIDPRAGQNQEVAGGNALATRIGQQKQAEGRDYRGHNLQRLRAARLRLGLTQVDAALRVGVTPAVIYRWEAGRARPRNRAIIDRVRELLAEAENSENSP